MAETYFGLTDTGRQRTNNEDAFIAQPILGDRFIAACVIDGVGGYEGGEVAAAIAKGALLDYCSVLSGEVTAMLHEAVVSANEKIYAEKKRTGKYESMACVLTVALIQKEQNKFYYAHVGDTRLYLLRDGSLIKISKDQSFVGFLEDSGRLTEAEAMAHPKRNEINKALGFEVPLPNPADYIEIGESPFLPGDLLLLCSDGLTDMVNRKGIVDILTTKKSLALKSKALIDAANAAGGKDNITVVLVQNGAKPAVPNVPKTAILKKNDLPGKKFYQPQNQKFNKPATTTQLLKSNRYKIPFFIATFLFLATAGVLAWQLMGKKGAEESGLIYPNSVQKNSLERAFQDTLNNSGSDTLIFTNETFGQPIVLTDTSFITRSGLSIFGNGIEIVGDSLVQKKPVLYIAPTANNILFDSVVFKNLTVLITPGNKKNIRFRASKFVNASLLVVQPLFFNDTTVSGTMQNWLPVADSLKRNN